MTTLKNLALVLSTGYIFVYVSEHLFWARVRPDDSLADWLGAWVAYSFAAFAFLTLVAGFRVKRIWPLFLAGAALGWLTEGVIVHTTYEALPLSISFTGLAWHALLTVWVGWYAVRRSLLSVRPFDTLVVAAAVGLGYGLWAIAWWLEPDGGVASVSEFATFSLVTTVLATGAYWLANWSSSVTFRPNRWVKAGVCAAFAIYFGLVTVPATPLAAVILPVLLGLTYLGLRRNRLREGDGSLLDTLAGAAPAWKYLSLLALPATGTLVYALATWLQLRWQTNWLFYLVTTPLGFICFGLALYRAWYRPSHQA